MQCSINEPIGEIPKGACSMSDPTGIMAGVKYEQCTGLAVVYGKVGERLCRKHAADYPEPEFFSSLVPVEF